MSKHTPGPWKWNSDPDMGGFHVYMGAAISKRSGYESHQHLEMDFSIYPEDGEQWEEAKANTRLIAAAPELLEALVLLEREMVDSGNAGSADYGWKPAIEKTRAAIAKATGK